IVEYENNDKKMESVFSSKIRAGKRRTYFFDVRATKGNDYFLTITESRKRFDDNGYDRHKIFLYKEDFNKFLKALTESLDYVKTELMPDFDFDAFNHEYDPAFVPEVNANNATSSTEVKSNEVIEAKEVETPIATETTPITPASSGDNLSTEEVDKW
ncbi:MAG: hypothetical protein RLZZ391_1044, partial [Bacteroidota bacterium]